MIFKCLYCQEPLKDGDLVCATACEHFIHELCLETMKSMNDHICKNCNKVTVVIEVFKEFDKGKACTIEGLTTIIEKLNELIGIVKTRETELTELSKKHDEMSDKLEGLLIEHHAVKFEKNEIDKRLKKVEHEICVEKHDH